jgi:hypothetical protein
MVVGKVRLQKIGNMKVKKIVTVDCPPGRYAFECPGCGDNHVISTEVRQDNGAIWRFNGDVDKPTFTPSLLIQSGHYVAGFLTSKEECYFCKENMNMCYICHSFITDGKIQFLSDCTHPLAGQTVELLDVD